MLIWNAGIRKFIIYKCIINSNLIKQNLIELVHYKSNFLLKEKKKKSVIKITILSSKLLLLEIRIF